MKVLLIHTYYKLRGGEDFVFESEVDNLKKNGIEVETLNFTNQINTLFKVIFWFFNPFSYYLVSKKIKEFKPDVIHFHNLHFAASPSVIWAAFNHKIPAILSLHNYRIICPSGILYQDNKLFLLSLKGGFPWMAVKKKVYKNSLLLTFWLACSIQFNKLIGTWKKLDKILVLSPFAKNLFLQSALGINKNKFVVKPNFVTHVEQEKDIIKKGFVYIGRLSAEKGIDILIKTYKLHPFDLTIIGDGPLRTKVIEFCEANEMVTYMGFQQKNEINKILSTAEILLFPSKCFEGMPMTILEAFSFGTPVIASNLGPIPTIVTDKFNGLLFENMNNADFYEKIKYWSSLSKKEKTYLSANAYATYTERFSSEVNLTQLLNVYENVMAKKN